MNKKGQMNIGIILIVFVSLIVGVILFQTIAQEVGDSTTLLTLSNESFTSAAVGESVYLTNYKNIASVEIYNATGTLVPAANYTVTNNVVYNGALAVKITTGAVNEYAEQVWNISGTAQALDYIDNSGGRAMASLIVIFFALAIAVVALTPTLRSELLKAFGK